MLGINAHHQKDSLKRSIETKKFPLNYNNVLFRVFFASACFPPFPYVYASWIKHWHGVSLFSACLALHHNPRFFSGSTIRDVDCFTPIYQTGQLKSRSKQVYISTFEQAGHMPIQILFFQIPRSIARSRNQLAIG
jgi:hypothetical protein